MTDEIGVTVGEVWEHRHYCLMCNTAKKHRHRYLVTSLPKDRPDVVIVRDLTVEATSPIGDRYATPRDRFGSLAKGGLRLAGYRVGGKFEPVRDLDTRLVDHPRIGPRSRYRIPKTAAAGALA